MNSDCDSLVNDSGVVIEPYGVDLHAYVCLNRRSQEFALLRVQIWPL
jgi:hypothetical protein